MDPVSQGSLGAAFSQSFANKKQILAASLFGIGSGMAPDLDVLIRSPSDPLLFLEFHRQFTHSLIFIPIGGFICGLFFYALLGKRLAMSFMQVYLFCTLGYATHALLDTCTSYGTQLLWPFSDARFAWNTISIIDPIFTVPLVVLVALAAFRRNANFARAAMCWVLIYQSVGIYQNKRVADIGYQLAAERGHTPIRLEAKPSFGNLVLWKVVYEIEDGFYTDGVRAGQAIKVYPGNFVPRLNLEKDIPWLNPDSQQAKDVERFRWFSKGYLALDPNNPMRIIDMRYSLVPNEATGMWSIWLSKEAADDEHVTWKPDRDLSGGRRETFNNMLFDKL